MNSATRATRSSSRAGVERLQRLILRRTWASLWRHLPMLAIGAATTALGAGTAALLAGGSKLLFPLLLLVLCGPTLMALQTVVHGALVEDDTDVRAYLRALRGTALRSAGHCLPTAFSLVSLLAAAEVYGRTQSVLVLISLGTAITATALTIAGLAALIPLSVARPELRPMRLWVTAWHLVGRWPVRFLAPIALAGLALWAAVSVSSALVMLLPAGISLLAGAAFWCCAVEMGADDVVDLDHRRPAPQWSDDPPLADRQTTAG